MPPPEEIKKLAEQYAEFTDMSPVDQLRIKLISKEFLTWVCKTHCIVPKERLIDINKEVTRLYLDQNHLSFDGWRYILNELFGTALFNEEKE